MYGLERGNEVLKQIHQETSIEHVVRVMDDAAESQQYQQVRELYFVYLLMSQEINDMLSSNLSADEQQAVEDELGMLETQLGTGLSTTRVSHPNVAEPVLPNAPQSKIIVSTKSQASAPTMQKHIWEAETS